MTRFTVALAWLDLRIAAEAQRLRARYELSLDELRGLFISDPMVDAVLAGTEAAQPAGPVPDAPLGGLVAEVGLDPPAEAALLVLLAPDLDPRYWTLYAYLNDDVARRWATPELVGRLLGAPAASQFAPATALVRAGLAVPADPADAARPLLLRGWRAAPAVVHRALDLPGQHAAWLAEAGDRAASAPAPPALLLAPPWPALLVTGPPETGRVALAARHAAAVGRGTLLFRPAGLCDGLGAALAEALAATRLDQAMLVVDGGEVEPFAIPGDDVPVAVVARAPGAWPTRLHPRLVLPLGTAPPPAAARAAQWRAALATPGSPPRRRPRGWSPTASASAPPRSPGLPAGWRSRRPARLARSPIGWWPPRAARPPPIRARSRAGCRSRPAGTISFFPAGALRQLRDFAAAIGRRGDGLRRLGLRRGRPRHRLRPRRPVLGRLGHGQDHERAGSSPATRARPLDAIDLSADGQQVHRRDREEPRAAILRRGRRQRDPVLRRGRRALRQAQRGQGRARPLRQHRDRLPAAAAGGAPRAWSSWPPISAATSTPPSCAASPSSSTSRCPTPAARAGSGARRSRRARRSTRASTSPRSAARFELTGGDIRTAALEAGFLAAGNGGLIDGKAIEIAVARQLLKRGQLPASAPPRAGDGRGPRPPRSAA